MPPKILIIGGVAAGASAAAKARRTSEATEITILEQGPHVSFANCGLPYYVSKIIPDREDLLITTPAKFKENFNITVRLHHQALAIDRANKRVAVKDLHSGEDYLENYDKLILATGNKPLIPPVAGADLANIFNLWTIPDADSIIALLEQYREGSAVVVGGGFVGLEAVDALHTRGFKVALVEMLPQVLPAWDEEMASLVSDHLQAAGIEVIMRDGVKRFLGQDRLQQVELQSGRYLPADLGILSVGVRPRLELAQQAGLEIGAAGGLVVNDRMQTSDPDIYAAGDIVQATHLVSGQQARVPLAGPANKQGRVAGANAAGGNLLFRGVLGSSIVKVGELTVAKAGLSAREASQSGYQFFASYTYPQNHAGYYPGARTMVLKLVADEVTGRLLGAQAVGTEGVDKQMAVLATALAAGMTVTDLENLELPYSPPYSSAKDPVTMAGMVAANIWRGEAPTITVQQLREEMEGSADLQIVDVRTAGEYQRGHIPGALHIPLHHLRQQAGSLDPGKRTVVYCRSAYRSYLALKILQHRGFQQVLNMSGGYLNWVNGL